MSHIADTTVEGFPGYAEALARARARTGSDDAVTVRDVRIAGRSVVEIAFDFRVLGGSLGTAAGEAVVQAFDRAAYGRRPVVSYIASGGARMQEGMRSLVQLQRIAAAIVRLRRSGQPHVAVADHPTTGGVWAVLGSSADVVLGLRGATVAFAGTRVRPHDEVGSFSAAGKVATGFADAEVDREEVAAAVATWIGLLTAPRDDRPCPPPAALGEGPASDDAWAAVLAARSPARPRAADYLDAYLEERAEISGDRCGGVDPSMLCGVGLRDGSAIAFVAQTGTANRPSGFRTATRLLRMAERLRLPVLTLIDTPGAANDAAAEEQGIGTAIGEAFLTMTTLTVPVTSVLVGEGGSGGALALAAPGALWATPDSYFAVIAPEAAASILDRARDDAPALSRHMGLRPPDLHRDGIVQGVLEPGVVAGI